MPTSQQVNETAVLCIFALGFLLVITGTAMLFIGGLALMSVKCVVFGGPLLLLGLGMWFAADRL